MKKPPPRPPVAARQDDTPDGFALPLDGLLRESPDVAPSPGVWDRIEAALRDDASPGGIAEA